MTLNGGDRIRKPPAAVQAVYDALIVQWLAAGLHMPGEARSTPTVSEMVLQFYRH